MRWALRLIDCFPLRDLWRVLKPERGTAAEAGLACGRGHHGLPWPTEGPRGFRGALHRLFCPGCAQPLLAGGAGCACELGLGAPPQGCSLGSWLCWFPPHSSAQRLAPQTGLLLGMEGMHVCLCVNVCVCVRVCRHVGCIQWDRSSQGPGPAP